MTGPVGKNSGEHFVTSALSLCDRFSGGRTGWVGCLMIYLLPLVYAARKRNTQASSNGGGGGGGLYGGRGLAPGF